MIRDGELQIVEGLFFGIDIKDYYELGVMNEKDLHDILNKKLLEIPLPIKLLFLGDYLWILGKDIKMVINRPCDPIFDLINKLHPINLTEKGFVSYLFIKQFSDNLIECYIDGEIYNYEYFENNILFGTHINDSYEYLKIMELETVNFLYIKLQPKNENGVVTLGRNNNLKFNKKMNQSQIKKVLNELTLLYLNYSLEVEQQ